MNDCRHVSGGVNDSQLPQFTTTATMFAGSVWAAASASPWPARKGTTNLHDYVPCSELQRSDCLCVCAGAKEFHWTSWLDVCCCRLHLRLRPLLHRGWLKFSILVVLCVIFRRPTGWVPLTESINSQPTEWRLAAGPAVARRPSAKAQVPHLRDASTPWSDWAGLSLSFKRQTHTLTDEWVLNSMPQCCFALALDHSCMLICISSWWPVLLT